MAKKRPLSIVIGSFSDPANQIWAPNAHAFATAKEAVEFLGTRDAYYEDFAYELKIKKEEVPAALENMNPVLTMEALISVLQMNPGMAIKTFRTFREAEVFLDFIEQLAEKNEKARERDARLI